MRLPKVYKDIFILFYGDLLAIPPEGGITSQTAQHYDHFRIAIAR